MASIINATTTAGVSVQGDNSGSLQLATNNGTTAVTIDTNQRAAFVAGTAALPAITTTGDTNTGIFFPAADTMAFAEGGTEVMRINSAGYSKFSNNGTYAGSPTGIYHEFNQNGNSDTLGLYSTASSGNQYGLYISTANNQDDTSRYFLYCAGGGAQKASFYTNGGLYNYSANNVNLSDRREKTNFAPAKPYLDIICSIPVQTFHYIDQNLEDNNDLTLGVVAQDVQIVAPELVTESNWASKGEPEKMRLSIYQTDLQYALMKSIQELKAELDATKAEVQALKGTL